MARIAGVDLPKNKNISIALTYLYGIGRNSALKILKAIEIDPGTKVKDLTEEEVSKISREVSERYKVEGELRREIQQNINRLIDINSYRGMRHKNHLPVRGQRTRTNARTRKGHKPSIGSKRK
ncbi:MAG: 30S ribosomal protein S13 [Thermotoga sp.]|nr:MAG: 30S ribosomal protein S13 [Thermotoga sp.]